MLDAGVLTKANTCLYLKSSIYDNAYPRSSLLQLYLLMLIVIVPNKGF